MLQNYSERGTSYTMKKLLPETSLCEGPIGATFFFPLSFFGDL